MSQKIVYLAGPMSGRGWEEVLGERQRATLLLNTVGFKVLDPARGRFDGHEAVVDSSQTPHARDLVERDLADVKRADMLLVLNADKYGLGTAFEWAWARSLGKPVFIIADPSIDMGPWSRVMATASFGNIEDAVDHISALWSE